MKVYTKKGDKGETSLIGGTRLAKSAPRIEAYGTVDELNSHIGWVRDQEAALPYKSVLVEIQDRLFTMGSTLAADPEHSRMKLPELSESDVTFLEEEIDKMETKLPPMKSFVLPGGHVAVSACHVARCVCRRAERRVVELASEEQVSPLIMSYLNRLSDYLFVLSRKIAHDLNAEETPWVARL